MEGPSVVELHLSPRSSPLASTFKRPHIFEDLLLDVPQSPPLRSPSTGAVFPRFSPPRSSSGDICNQVRQIWCEWRPATISVVRSPSAALVSHLGFASAAEMDRMWVEDESPSNESLRPDRGDDSDSPRWFWGANRGRRAEARRSSSDSERTVVVRAPVLVPGSSSVGSSSSARSPALGSYRSSKLQVFSQGYVTTRVEETGGKAYPVYSPQSTATAPPATVKPRSNGHWGSDPAAGRTETPHCLCFSEYTGVHRRTCSLQTRLSSHRNSSFETTVVRRRASLDGEKGLVSCLAGSPRSRGRCGFAGVRRRVSFDKMVHVCYIGVADKAPPSGAVQIPLEAAGKVMVGATA